MISKINYSHRPQKKALLMLPRNIISQKNLSVDVGGFLVDADYDFLVIVSR